MVADAEPSVQLVSHASIRIRVGTVDLLCDPWLFGSVFNDGWQLSPTPNLDDLDVSTLTHLWISHEHPDHFHLPSLRWLTERIDPSAVVVMFQKTNSSKMFDVFTKLGFSNQLPMPHLKTLPISDRVEGFVYASRQLDSALGLRIDGHNAVLNINDTGFTHQDRQVIRNRYGSFPVLFNQFSIAGFSGHPDPSRTERIANEVLRKLVIDHNEFGARVTVPFASYMYFCQQDNVELNRYMNSALDAERFMADFGCRTALLPVGGPEVALEDVAHSGDRAYYESFYADQVIEPVPLQTVSWDQCVDAFAARTGFWKEQTFPVLYNRLEPISAYVADLDQSCVLDFGRCRLVTTSDTQESAQLVINSQPLANAFATPWGVQTLGVSGRYRFESYPPTWKLVRMISSLANADVFLSWDGLTDAETLSWAWERRQVLGSQIMQQVNRFRS